MGSWRGLFNIHTLNTIHWYSHATFVCVFYLCGIAIQHSCFIVIHNSTPIFQNPIFNLFNSTLRIDNSTSIFVSNTIHMRHSFVCSTSTFVASNAWWVCCAAECDMLAAQCNILVWTLNFPFPLSCTHCAAYGWCTTTWLTSSHYINQPWANFARRTKKKRENACSLALTHVTRIEPQGLFREEVLARLLCVSFYFVTKVLCIF